MQTPQQPIPPRPLSAAELHQLGYTPTAIRTLVGEGRLRRALRDVYLDAAVPDTPATRAACAAKVLPEGRVICDLTGAWILGVDAFEPASLDIDPLLDVVSTGGRDRPRRPEILGGKRALTIDDLIEVDGVVLTSPLRTACDIACLRGRRRALAVLDQFCRLYGLGPQDFERILPRYRGRRGCRQLRELVHYADGRAESPGESWTRLAIIDAGLPVPTPQVTLTVPGWGELRLDLAYPHLKIAVEYDGEEFHGKEQEKHDEQRRAALARAGWHVIVVRKSQLSGRGLDRWIEDLSAELRARRSPGKRVYSKTLVD